MAWTRPSYPLVETSEVAIAGPGGDLPLRIYAPPEARGLPVLLYFHGGGFVFGSLDEADAISSAFAMLTPCVVVSVGYRLAPEHPYPAALEDAWAALSWLESGIEAYGGLASRIAVGGESAGANLAAVLCLRSRDRGGPAIAFQLLLCPWLDLSDFGRPSHRLFGDGPWLSLSSLGLYRGLYLGPGSSPESAEISPLLAKDLGGLPPAHLLCAEFDPLRDEGEAYASRLRDAGLDATHRRYEGMIHSFFVLNGITAKAEAAVEDCATILRMRMSARAKPPSAAKLP